MTVRDAELSPFLSPLWGREQTAASGNMVINSMSGQR